MGMSRLESHRAEFHRNKRLGHLIWFDDLEPEEQAAISKSVIENVRRSGAENLDGFYEVYVQTFHDWGIMCPHPQPRRLYDGWRRSESPERFEDSRWYHCELCETAVINR